MSLSRMLRARPGGILDVGLWGRRESAAGVESPWAIDSSRGRDRGCGSGACAGAPGVGGWKPSESRKDSHAFKAPPASHLRKRDVLRSLVRCAGRQLVTAIAFGA